MPFVSDLSRFRILEAMEAGIGGVPRPLTASGASPELSYQFADGTAPADLPDYAGWTPLDAAERRAVTDALARIEAVIDVDFTRVTGASDPDIDIGKVALPEDTAGRGGRAWRKRGDTLLDYDGFALYDRDEDVSEQPGVIVHELAHAMGLAHPFGGDATLPAPIETNKVSVMSYTPNPDTGAEARTLQLYDVLALQDLWTANPDTRAGDTIYEAPAGGRVEVVWDGGGHDMLDAGGRPGGAVLDLRAGAFSRFGDHPDLAIAYDTEIEAARGGGGDDRLLGNAAANRMAGGDGADFVRAGAGADRVFGGQGGDTVYAGPGDAGDDLLRGGRGPDILGGGAGDDRLRGGRGTDTLYGGDGRDELRGFGGDDAAWAGEGADTVSGDGGGDRIGGGPGADTLRGGGGRDTLYAGPDASGDTLFGGGADDLVFGGAGRDELRGNLRADTLYGGPGADTIDAGAGADTLWGGPGADTLAGAGGADAFAFVTGAGADTIADFEPGRDVVAIREGAASMDDLALGRTGGDATDGRAAGATDGRAAGATVAFADVEITLAGVDRAALDAEVFAFA